MKRLFIPLSILFVAFSITLFAQGNLSNLEVNVNTPKASIHNHPLRDGHKPLAKTPKPSTAYIALYDSIYNWYYDTSINGWHPPGRYKTVDMVYDANNNLINEVEESWSGSSWGLNNVHYSYAYNANNEDTCEIEQKWNGTAWLNFAKYLNSFDANNNNILYIEQSSLGVSWTNQWRYVYTFDAQNNNTYDTTQKWNGTAWVTTQVVANKFNANNKLISSQVGNFSLSTRSYDVNNNLTIAKQQLWGHLGWMNSARDTMSYDIHNNLIDSIYQTWNGSAWVNNIQYLSTYDINNNVIGYLQQTWIGSAWVNSGQSIYTYDANKNKTSLLVQTWNGSIWVNANYDLYAYDANNNFINQLGQTWYSSAWQKADTENNTYDSNNIMLSSMIDGFVNYGKTIDNGDSTYWYFHVITGINSVKANSSPVKIYPNPNNGQFTLSSSKITNKCTLEIYNVLGQPLLTGIFRSSLDDNLIDLTNQPSGVYFYRAISETGDLLGEGKLIIQK